MNGRSRVLRRFSARTRPFDRDCVNVRICRRPDEAGSREPGARSRTGRFPLPIAGTLAEVHP